MQAKGEIQARLPTFRFFAVQGTSVMRENNTNAYSDARPDKKPTQGYENHLKITRPGRKQTTRERRESAYDNLTSIGKGFLENKKTLHAYTAGKVLSVRHIRCVDHRRPPHGAEAEHSKEYSFEITVVTRNLSNPDGDNMRVSFKRKPSKTERKR